MEVVSNLEQLGIPSASIRYLALGDSYTIGTGGPPSRSFPARLVERWHARGLVAELRNLGVSGYTSDDLIRDELPRVASFAPTLVTLLIGTNDIVGGRDPWTYRGRLRVIIERLAKQLDPSRVVVVSSPDWSGAPRGADFGDAEVVARLVGEYAGVAREEASRSGTRFFDVVPLSRQQANDGKWAPDRLHFSATAYGEWAEALDTAMTSWGLP